MDNTGNGLNRERIVRVCVVQQNDSHIARGALPGDVEGRTGSDASVSGIGQLKSGGLDSNGGRSGHEEMSELHLDDEG